MLFLAVNCIFFSLVVTFLAKVFVLLQRPYLRHDGLITTSCGVVLWPLYRCITQSIRSDMSDLEELRKAIVEFTQERDWDQFHNGKDLALALSIEASELNEAFLWKDANEVKVEKVKEELADIVNYAILIADKYNLDIKQIVLDKLKRNAEKYPVDKAYGSAKKYNEL